MRTDTRVLSLRLEDGILITGCGEVWRTETRPVILNTALASGRRYIQNQPKHIRKTPPGQTHTSGRRYLNNRVWRSLEDGDAPGYTHQHWRLEDATC